MERNSSRALRAPGAFGASGKSDPHGTLPSCSLHITHVFWLPVVLRPSAALSTFGRSTADDAASGRAGASGASCTFLSMRVCCRSVATHARLLARSGASAAAPQRTRASNEALKWPSGLHRAGSTSFSLRTARPSCSPALHRPQSRPSPPHLRKSCCKKRPEL
jgi:hypothetical protein